MSRAAAQNTRVASASNRREHVVWKNELLDYLTRLKDVDTQASGARGIHGLMERIDEGTFPIFLGAVRKGWSDRQRPSTRREYVRLISAAARLCPGLCGTYLPRTVNVVMGWSCDVDSAVRESCADCMGDLAEFAISHFHATHDDATGLGVFFRPILSSCKPSEGNFHKRMGALLCLARVVFRVDCELLQNELDRLLPRIVDSYLGDWIGKGALARGLLHDVVANIVKRMCLINDDPSASPLAGYMADLTGFFLDDLHGAKEWKTRERAASALGCVGLHYYLAARESGTRQSHIEAECGPILDGLLFAKSDRTSNVREAVIASIEVFCEILGRREDARGTTPPNRDPGGRKGTRFQSGNQTQGDLQEHRRLLRPLRHHLHRGNLATAHQLTFQEGS